MNDIIHHIFINLIILIFKKKNKTIILFIYFLFIHFFFIYFFILFFCFVLFCFILLCFALFSPFFLFTWIPYILNILHK